MAASLFLFIAAGCGTVREAGPAPLERIAFGSCINTNAHPMLDRTLWERFDLMVLLGDNIYADTTDMSVMAWKYRQLKESDFWRELRRKSPVLATWDDHDFGANDAGAEYPMRAESQRLFLEFLDEPPGSPRWSRPGVFDAAVFGPRGKRVQVILLDTRYFRSPPATGENNVVPSGGRYIPTRDTNTTILGEAQWGWLAEQLRVPAEVRVIASSIQFISEFSGAEAWANFPHEKRRMLGLLAETRANGVVFISGDRHWAEISRMDRPGNYPLFDFTSSALTQKHPRGTPTPNRYRDQPMTVHEANLGVLEIDWKRTPPGIRFELIDEAGVVRLEREFELR